MLTNPLIARVDVPEPCIITFRGRPTGRLGNVGVLLLFSCTARCFGPLPFGLPSGLCGPSFRFFFSG